MGRFGIHDAGTPDPELSAASKSYTSHSPEPSSGSGSSSNRSSESACSVENFVHLSNKDPKLEIGYVLNKAVESEPPVAFHSAPQFEEPENLSDDSISDQMPSSESNLATSIVKMEQLRDEINLIKSKVGQTNDSVTISPDMFQQFCEVNSIAQEVVQHIQNELDNQFLKNKNAAQGFQSRLESLQAQIAEMDELGTKRWKSDMLDRTRIFIRVGTNGEDEFCKVPYSEECYVDFATEIIVRTVCQNNRACSLQAVLGNRSESAKRRPQPVSVSCPLYYMKLTHLSLDLHCYLRSISTHKPLAESVQKPTAALWLILTTRACPADNWTSSRK